MEKYRPFQDQGTGVHPFVPLWSHHRSSLPVKILKVLLSPLAVLRLLLLFLSFLLLGLADVLSVAIPLGFLRYPVYRLLTKFAASLSLLILGLVPTGKAAADHRRLKIPLAKAKGAGVFDARMGCLVIVNQQGVADVLYLCYELSPTFVFVDLDGKPIACGAFNAIQHALSRSPLKAPGKGDDLAKVAASARSGWQGPVVVFPEGARTTGNCVLPWEASTFEGLDSFEKPVGAAICALAYSKTGPYTMHHTVNKPLLHLFYLCLQPFHTVSATWLSSLDAATSLKGKPKDEQAALLRTLLTRMVPDAVEVQTNAKIFYEFWDFWDAAQKKGYTQKPKTPSKKKA